MVEMSSAYDTAPIRTIPKYYMFGDHCCESFINGNYDAPNFELLHKPLMVATETTEPS